MKRQTKSAAQLGFHKMPLLSPEMAAVGISPGGEGGQWPRDLVWGRNQIALCIDVGGLYLSQDSGRSWNLSMEGFYARGCNTIAFDPHGSAPMLAVGGNSSDFNPGWLGGKTPHGLYRWLISESRWEHVVPVFEGTGGRVAYDPYSYNVIPGTCQIAYYLTPKSGLFLSDGYGRVGFLEAGKTWTRVSDPLGGEDREAFLRIGPQPGVYQMSDLAKGKAMAPRDQYIPGLVWVGGKRGLLVSKDKGKTFQRLREQPVTGLEVTDLGVVFVSDLGGVHRSDDSGKSWTTLPSKGLEQKGKPVLNVQASPADPKRLSCWVQGDNWQWVRYTSHDGGSSWQPIRLDNKESVLPNNARNGYFAWSPTDPNTVFGIGGDIITKSIDGGRTFRWSANGYNGIMLGGQLSFSEHAPESVFLAFQDYNAALTSDGGKTWRYLDASGKGWGGFCYGGHTPDGQTLYYGDAESWGGKRRLRISYDSGKTWQFVGALTFSGPDVSGSDPTDKNTLFASNLRSGDAGKTWNPMPDCDGVYTHAAGALIGKKGRRVVRSTDHGATWQTVAEAPSDIADIAVDPKRNRTYVALRDKLMVWDGTRWQECDTPRDQYGNRHVKAVAVNPQKPELLYIGGSADIYATNATLCASRDAGKTWENLTVSDGPREVGALRVHPKTGELWLNGQCFGMWRLKG